MTHKRSSVMLVVVAGLLALGGGAAFSSTTLASPTISSGPSTASSSRAATFAFTGPSGSTLRCGLDGAALTACSSPWTYNSLTEGAHSFSVAALKSGQQSPTTTYNWSVDTVAPPAPTLTTKPPDPTSTATNDFAWTSAESGVTSQCSVENGAWFACSSPYRWVIDTSNSGQHQFAVRSSDAAGNTSPATAYRFQYQKGLPTSGVPFQITGSVSPLAIGIWQTIALKITNPNPVTIFVSALRVDVAADSTPTGCAAAGNLELEQSNISTTTTLSVPANSSITLPAPGITAPRIRLRNLPTVNQDVCKNKSFVLSYSGTATN